MKKFILVQFSFFVFQSTAFAQENLESSVDCTNIQVDYVNDSTLTREERIHHMDRAFYRALNKFELCQLEKKKKLESNSANGNPSGTGDSAGSAEGGVVSESVASSIMSGTELSVAKDKVNDGEREISSEMKTTNNENGKYEGNISLPNGKLPDDIPSADNDSALAAQIRRAAENETDPDKKKQLWNEYRKYKGLPNK